MTLNPVCENVETAQGVPLTVTGVAQVKIMKNPELLHTASEQFLGKKEHEIKSTVLQTLEGHLRAILGTLTVEEVYKDRDQFASLVREVAAPDVGRMGIEILSFTIKDVYDNVDYLSSLGKTQTAAVKRDAEIGVAQANRQAFKAYDNEGKIDSKMFQHALTTWGDKMTKAEIDDIFGEFEIDEDYMIKTKDVISLFVAVKEEPKAEEPAPVEEAPVEEEEDADAKKKKKKKKKAAK